MPSMNKNSKPAKNQFLYENSKKDLNFEKLKDVFNSELFQILLDVNKNKDTVDNDSKISGQPLSIRNRSSNYRDNRDFVESSSSEDNPLHSNGIPPDPLVQPLSKLDAAFGASSPASSNHRTKRCKKHRNVDFKPGLNGSTITNTSKSNLEASKIVKDIKTYIPTMSIPGISNCLATSTNLNDTLENQIAGEQLFRRPNLELLDSKFNEIIGVKSPEQAPSLIRSTSCSNNNNDTSEDSYSISNSENETYLNIPLSQNINYAPTMPSLHQDSLRSSSFIPTQEDVASNEHDETLKPTEQLKGVTTSPRIIPVDLNNGSNSPEAPTPAMMIKVISEREFHDLGYDWQLMTINLHKNGKGLGFTLSGGSDNNTNIKFCHLANNTFLSLDIADSIIVTKLIPGGTAQMDGQLKIDDVILQVDDRDLSHVEHDQAVDILKSTGNSVNLTIKRMTFRRFPDQFIIILKKPIDGGLGFSITGGIDNEHTLIINGHETIDPAIFVAKIVSGGVADLDGRIMLDDKIIQVNTKSLCDVTHQEAVNILKAIKPNTYVSFTIQRPKSDSITANTLQQRAFINGESMSLINKIPPRLTDETDFNNGLGNLAPMPINSRAQNGIRCLADNSFSTFEKLSDNNSPSRPNRFGDNKTSRPNSFSPNKIRPINTTNSISLALEPRSGNIEILHFPEPNNSLSRKTKYRSPLIRELREKLNLKDSSSSSTASYSSSPEPPANYLLVEEFSKELESAYLDNQIVIQGSKMPSTILPARQLNYNTNNSNELDKCQDSPLTPTNLNEKKFSQIDPMVEMRKFGPRYESSISPPIIPVKHYSNQNLRTSDNTDLRRPSSFNPNVSLPLPRDNLLVKRVSLVRSASPNKSLGFNITGGYYVEGRTPPGHVLNTSPLTDSKQFDPICVAQIIPNKPAALSGKIHPGDQIISVNGHSLMGCSHEEAVKILRNTGAQVYLELALPPSNNTCLVSDITTKHHVESISSTRPLTQPPTITLNVDLPPAPAITPKLGPGPPNIAFTPSRDFHDLGDANLQILNHSSPLQGGSDDPCGRKDNNLIFMGQKLEQPSTVISQLANHQQLVAQQNLQPNCREKMEEAMTLKKSFFARALIDYEPSEDKSHLPGPGLAFRYGDLLYLSNASDDTWWKAQKLKIFRDYYPLSSFGQQSDSGILDTSVTSNSLANVILAFKDPPFGLENADKIDSKGPNSNCFFKDFPNSSLDISTPDTTLNDTVDGGGFSVTSINSPDIGNCVSFGLIPSIKRIRRKQKYRYKTVKFKGNFPYNDYNSTMNDDSTDASKRLNESFTFSSDKNGSCVNNYMLGDSVDSIAIAQPQLPYDLQNHNTHPTGRRKLKKPGSTIFHKLPSFMNLMKGGGSSNGKEYILPQPKYDPSGHNSNNVTDGPGCLEARAKKTSNSSMSLNKLTSTNGNNHDKSLLALGLHHSSCDQLDTLIYQPVTLRIIPYKRPIILLGPLKDRICDNLIKCFPEKFTTPTPHTTRPQRADEIDGGDYHFITPELGGLKAMEDDIRAGKYIEAGQYNGNLYGTSLEDVKHIAFTQQKHCILDVSGNAIKRLISSGIYPIVIFLKPPSNSSFKSITPGIHDEEAKKAFEKCLAIQQEFHQYFNGVVPIASFDVMIDGVIDTIEKHSNLKVWVPTGETL